MRFGIFLAPFHSQIGEDLTSAYARDVEVLQLLDRVGYDEAWIGEHHSGGAEPIPDPAMFIAHVANLTRHIKLGTGVASLPYHNPFLLAERMVFLDHLTRGRMMLGLGPGAFGTDAVQIGINPGDMRLAFEEDIDVVMHLLTCDEPLSVKTARYHLEGARLQLAPYTFPMFEVAVTAVVSPNGPTIAGKHGASMLSVAASSAAGYAVLGQHWDVFSTAAAAHGHVADRRSWRLVCPMHIAPTKDQAIADVKFGIEQYQRYMNEVLHGSVLLTNATDHGSLVEWINESEFGVIGTAADAIELIERFDEKSGGFGTLLLLHHEWAGHAETLRHYELFARFVKPHFQHVAKRLRDNADWCAEANTALRPQIVQSQMAMIERHKQRQAAQDADR